MIYFLKRLPFEKYVPRWGYLLFCHSLIQGFWNPLSNKKVFTLNASFFKKNLSECNSFLFFVCFFSQNTNAKFLIWCYEKAPHGTYKPGKSKEKVPGPVIDTVWKLTFSSFRNALLQSLFHLGLLRKYILTVFYQTDFSFKILLKWKFDDNFR